MMPTHFHLLGQPWQFHNTVSSLYGEQTHSTMSLLTTQLAHYSKNEKQQQQNLTQHINHNEIIHLHWCFRYQRDILSTNQVQLNAPATGLGGHSDVAMYTDR